MLLGYDSIWAIGEKKCLTEREWYNRRLSYWYSSRGAFCVITLGHFSEVGERLWPRDGEESGPLYVPASEAGMHRDALVMLLRGIWYLATTGRVSKRSAGSLVCCSGWSCRRDVSCIGGGRATVELWGPQKNCRAWWLDPRAWLHEPWWWRASTGSLTASLTRSCQADRQVAPMGLARSRRALEVLRRVGGRRAEHGRGDSAGPSIPPAFSQC